MGVQGLIHEAVRSAVTDGSGAGVATDASARTYFLLVVAPCVGIGIPVETSSLDDAADTPKVRDTSDRVESTTDIPL